MPKEASIAIGDRLDTDIEAGNRGDYDSLAVLTGVTNPDRTDAGSVTPEAHIHRP